MRLASEFARTWREGGARALGRRLADRCAFEIRRIRERTDAAVRRARGIRARAGWRGVLAAARARVRYAVLRLLGRGQSEAALIEASSRYWNEGDKSGVDLGDFSHWVGTGPWQDRERWLRLGRVHRHMLDRLCTLTGAPRPRRMLEWGCGGGANAIHFIDDLEEFCGVEISQASLDECRRVLVDAGFGGFRPLLVDAAAPEQALQLGEGSYDCFLSAYVFELLPSKSYVARVLSVAAQLLRPGGLALVQIRYDDGTARSRQHHADYFRNSTRFTSFRVEDFWVQAERVGFRPEYVTLVPRRTEDYSGDLYAYFAMVKPAAAR